jgi:hypothetical protein
MVFLFWSDVNLKLRTTTSRPSLGFFPKRWEEREVPVPAYIAEMLARPSLSVQGSTPLNST